MAGEWWLDSVVSFLAGPRNGWLCMPGGLAATFLWHADHVLNGAALHPLLPQAVASAAVVDFDVPGAAWRCTPKALLAAGLLAEEGAKLELAARFPAPPQAPAGGTAREELQGERQEGQHRR